MSPEKMSADELCLVLQEKAIDIEDIRGLLVKRLKNVIRDELEKLKGTKGNDKGVAKGKMDRKRMLSRDGR